MNQNQPVSFIIGKNFSLTHLSFAGNDRLRVRFLGKSKNGFGSRVNGFFSVNKPQNPKKDYFP